MTVSRRRLLQSIALTGACGTAAAAPESVVALDALRTVSAAHGINLSDDRLRVVQPVLEHNLPDLRELRAFEVDDAVGPTQGILDK